MVFADSINLARRLSSRTENDLLQDTLVETKMDYQQCKAISSKLTNIKNLPTECYEHEDIVSKLKTKPTQHTNSIAFEGMGSSAAAAAAARQHGKENYAQIQRRYTNTRRFTKDS